MDSDRKNESNIKKTHFAKLHERIQQKYAQMQIRLEKSKSMDSISCLGEEFVSDRRSVGSEVSEQYPEEANSGEKQTQYSITVENLNKNDAVLQDSDWTQLYESEITPAVQDDTDRAFFGSEFGGSQESVREESIEALEVFEDTTIPTTSPHKLSVREKLIAARKRRKEERSKKKEETESRRKEAEIENTDKFILSNKPGIDSFKKKNKVATATVALIEATKAENETAPDERPRQLYCRIRLGQEKYKSKAAKINSNVVSWQELFNLNLFEDNFLEITVWEKEKDVFVGRTTLDLSDFKQDITHKINKTLEESESPFQLFMLVTISGIVTNNLDSFDWNTAEKDILEMEKKFSWLVLNDDFDDIGSLFVIVYEAKGLSVTDTFASFVLDNTRVHTQTQHKTCNPCWMKMFNFTVLDATSILHVAVHHDDKKSDIVGQIHIPLLTIVSGEKKWYALKDVTLRERAKGANPRILLELHFFYNVVKSSIRVINPKAKILLEKEPDFKRQLFAKNINRAKVILDWLTAALRVIKNMFEWESRKLNVIALTVWLIFWWCYQAWMLPLLLLIPFYWYKPRQYHFTSWQPDLLWRPFKSLKHELALDSVSLTSVPKDSRSSLIRKINSLQEMVTTVQNTIGKAASLGESVKNLFNFTVPYLSCLAIIGILGIAVILRLIPCRIIFMLWGVHKFLRKTLRPDRIPNNEILDLLSRVPDDEMLHDCEELPLLPITDKNEILQRP